MFITFYTTRGNKKHSLALALTVTLALTLTFNHLTNKLLQATTMLCGLMY